MAYLAAFLSWEQRLPVSEEVGTVLRKCGTDPEWETLVNQILQGLESRESVEAFCHSIGVGRKGVSGYVYQTVPVALFSALMHGKDFRKALEAVLNLGGDTDTAGAITGAICGCLTATEFPEKWVLHITDWPLSSKRLHTCGDRLFDTALLVVPGPCFIHLWRWFSGMLFF